jgi:hypothetical protein
LVAQHLADADFDVYYHATTRSPVLPYGVIHQRHSFLDNYGESVTNYLYNLDDHRDRQVLLCVETPAIQPFSIPQTPFPITVIYL